jgi:hypothetical protein
VTMILAGRHGPLKVQEVKNVAMSLTTIFCLPLLRQKFRKVTDTFKRRTLELNRISKGIA